MLIGEIALAILVVEVVGAAIFVSLFGTTGLGLATSLLGLEDVGSEKLTFSMPNFSKKPELESKIRAPKPIKSRIKIPTLPLFIFINRRRMSLF